MGEFFGINKIFKKKAWTEWIIRAIIKENFDPTKT